MFPSTWLAYIKRLKNPYWRHERDKWLCWERFCFVQWMVLVSDISLLTMSISMACCPSYNWTNPRGMYLHISASHPLHLPQQLFSFMWLSLLTLSLKIMLPPHLFWDLFLFAVFHLDFFIVLTLFFLCCNLPFFLTSGILTGCNDRQRKGNVTGITDFFFLRAHRGNNKKSIAEV